MVGTLYDTDGQTVLEENHFNSWNSQLWRRVRNTFSVDLENMYRTLRSNGLFTLENMLTYFDAVTDIISPKMYNDSQQIKYINDGAVGMVALHGNRKLQIRKWLRERIAYLDSKYGYYAGGGVGENYCNFRMNYQGAVSLDISTYYTVYAKVRWATNNEQTIRIARGQKKTFSYYSDVGTDREVMIFLPESLKTIENISKIYPNSIDVSKATKLTQIEAHNTNLFSVDLSKNKYLRKVDFNGCERLGTETATMTLNFCKYLNEVDLRGTQITGVNFNTKGGSLRRIYYPESIQSVVLLNQSLLTDMILPYGANGENIATGLTTVNIENCPLIQKSNDTTTDPMSLQAMRYCRNISLNNAINLEIFNFNGFTRLSNVNLQNMETLKEIDFLNMTKIGEETTLKYIGVSACPNLKRISMNCDDPNYEIRWATKSLLDLQTAGAVEEISSNCVIKGLETIVLPRSIKGLYFTNEYGEGYSDIKNIWSAEACTVIKTAVYPEAQHLNSANEVNDYEGIDFRGLHLLNIDLGALVQIPDAINFSLYPTHVNPNFNLNRDGVDIPFLQPKGILDLSNYTESLAKFFNGVDLDKLYVTSQNDLPQTDFSYCFYGSFFENPDNLKGILDRAKTISNMEYCFCKTSVKDASVLSRVSFLGGASLRYCFSECANLSKLENIELGASIGDASYMFAGSGISSIKNVTTECGKIVGLFSNCDKLVSVENFNATGTTSYESLFEGCCAISIAPITNIPNTIINISKMYKGCSSLTSINGMNLHKNIVNFDEFINDCPNLINANNVVISGSFYNDVFKGITSIKFIDNLLIDYVGRSMSFAHMFDGCSNLERMSFHDDSYVKDVVSMDYMFRGTSMRTVDFSNVNFEKISSYRYMFADCLMEEFSFTVPPLIMSIEGFLSGCSNLKTLRNFYITSNVITNKWLENAPVESVIDCEFYNQFTTFKNNQTLKRVENLVYTGTDFSNYFNGCSNLEYVGVTLTDTVTNLDNSFANCPNLIEIDFNVSDLSNVTSMVGTFTNDSSLNAIKNLRITNNSTVTDNTTLSGCPINNTDGFFINSNIALNMFRMGEEANITALTDFEIGISANDLSELFANYQHIKEDILIPNHVKTVERMFYNCTGLTKVHYNWQNTYDLNVDSDPNNDVITTDCYAGCVNIEYIEDDLYMNEYGELTAIYSIPEEWGGLFDCEPNETAFYINSDLLEDYTITLNGELGVYITDWGDGNRDKRTSHTYAKSGIFRIITENAVTFGTGNPIPSNFASAITRVIHLDETITNGDNLFKDCVNLLTIKGMVNTFNNANYMFQNCNNLTSTTLSQCTFTNTVTGMNSMFDGCYELSDDISLQISDVCENINNLFRNCNKVINISGTTFGEGITTVDNWLPPNLTIANNITLKNDFVKFTNANKLTNATDFKVTSNVTTLKSLFSGCSELKNINFTDVSDFSNITSTEEMFMDCSSLNVVKFTIGDRCTTSSRMFYNCPLSNMNGSYIGGALIEVVDFLPQVNFSADDITVKTSLKIFKGSKVTSIRNITIDNSVKDISSWFEGCVDLKVDMDIPLWVTNCSKTFKGCISITHVNKNWEKVYTSTITPTDCYSGCINITHIDDVDIGANEYTSGIDEIPLTWGGNEFYKAHTGIYRVKIPSDNYVWTPYGNSDDGNTYPLIANKRVDWGDGNATTGTGTHTYAKAGEYIIRGNLRLTREGYGAHDIVRDTLTEVMQFPTSITGYAEFYYCSLLKKVNITGGTFNGFCFRNCGALEEVICTDTVFKGNISGLFDNCPNLSKLNIENAEFLNVTSADTMFRNCSSLTTLNLGHMDLTTATNLDNFISNAELLSSFNAPKNISVSFNDFTYSIKLEHDDLMTIINNLSIVSTTQTLTLGRTNLAKLTTDEIQIAVDKGWTVV